MFKISCKGTKALAAADVAAPLTECVLKIDVSTPLSSTNISGDRALNVGVSAKTWRI